MFSRLATLFFYIELSLYELAISTFWMGMTRNKVFRRSDRCVHNLLDCYQSSLDTAIRASFCCLEVACLDSRCLDAGSGNIQPGYSNYRKQNALAISLSSSGSVAIHTVAIVLALLFLRPYEQPQIDDEAITFEMIPVSELNTPQQLDVNTLEETAEPQPVEPQALIPPPESIPPPPTPVQPPPVAEVPPTPPVDLPPEPAVPESTYTPNPVSEPESAPALAAPLPTPAPRMTPLIDEYRDRPSESATTEGLNSEAQPPEAQPTPSANLSQEALAAAAPVPSPTPVPSPPTRPPDILAGPVPGSQTPPQYPERARRREKEGRVGLSIQVTEAGRVGSINIASSSGDTDLDSAAIDAVRQWDFTPAQRGGVPISSWVSVTITFQLE